MAIKLLVFSLGRAFLSRFTQGIDLYTSAKFRALILTLIWTFPHVFCTIFLYYKGFPIGPKVITRTKIGEETLTLKVTPLTLM